VGVAAAQQGAQPCRAPDLADLPLAATCRAGRAVLGAGVRVDRLHPPPDHAGGERARAVTPAAPGARGSATGRPDPNVCDGMQAGGALEHLLPTLSREHVELATEEIREVRERSVITADGTEREVDICLRHRIPRCRDANSTADPWPGRAAARR
jgi:hypothetical protein